MSNNQKSELKIKLWEDEIKSLESELLHCKEQKAVWEGYAQGFQESLDLLNSFFGKIRLAMNWNQLTKTERDKYKKMAEQWPNMKRAEQVKAYKEIVKNFDEISINEQNEKLKSTPIPVPTVIMTEKEGAKMVELLQPLQVRLTNKLRQARTEPDMRLAQTDIVNKQIARLQKQIQSEQQKIDSSEDTEDYNDDYRSEISAENSNH